MTDARIELQRTVPYFMVENQLIDNGNLNIYEIAVYVSLCRYANNTTGECYPSLNTISKKLSISKPTVLKYLDSLIEKGCVSKKQNINEKGYNNNIYTIHGVVSEIDKGGKGDLLGVVKDVDKGGKGDLLYKDSLIKTHEEKTYNIVEIIDTPEIVFDRLWKLYPFKRGKGSVKLNTMNKLFKHGEDVITKCITRYVDYVAYRRTSFAGLSYMNGSTFFNSGYVDYLDENYEEVIAAMPQDNNDGVVGIANATDESNAEWAEMQRRKQC